MLYALCLLFITKNAVFFNYKYAEIFFFYSLIMRTFAVLS